MTKQTILILTALLVLVGCTPPILADSGATSHIEPVPTIILTPVTLAQATSTMIPATVPTLTLPTIPATSVSSVQLVPTVTHASPAIIPTETLIPAPASVQLNGLVLESFIYFPAEVAQHSQQILAHGQTLGRNLQHFSKIGDSIVDTEQFFVPFAEGNYSLGQYQYLTHAIDYYADSYSRFGFALRDGLNSTAVMDPMWADKEKCQANETPLACEIRLNNPSLMLIHFGTNDWTGTFEANMRQLIEHSIGEGIVPVLITKANRVDTNNERNDILRSLAIEYHIPLWDFDVIATTLPERGLAQDNAHLSISTEFDYTQSGLIYQGYKAFNLSGLMLLDAFVRRVVTVAEIKSPRQ